MYSKRTFYPCLALLMLVAGCVPATYLRQVPADFFRYTPTTKAAISAHRGGGDYTGYPENCIESFGWLARQMPVIIECDINMTKDSVLMMLHDNTLERTTTGRGRVKEVSWAYCQDLKLKDNKGNLTAYCIPTLEQVLHWGKNKVAYTLDVKVGVPYEKVIAAVQKAGAARYAAIITYNADDAAKVHRLDPDVMISVTIRNREEYDRLQGMGVPDNRMIAFVGTRQPDTTLLNFLHARGIRGILGTLGNLDKMAEARGDHWYHSFVQQGADILSTDRPLEAWKAISNHYRDSSVGSTVLARSSVLP
jgi:glycerophosphoryl diester phosphodiesterase